ncbi:MAG: hypothetical protein H6Q14_83 [Bacteroidetes bacterium]|jgi:hypothetical protein|nr:hypothetical protein [Bacteroidota bacterium]
MISLNLTLIMNDLIIKNKFPKLQQLASFACAGCLAVWSVYISFAEVFASRYSVLFYLAVGGLVLAVFTILSVTIWLPRPIFTISAEGLIPNLPNQSSLKPISWDEILDVNIGLNFFKITLKSSKNVNIDLSSIRYSDLKDIKSKVVEFCEAKDIPYKNA